MEDLTKWSLAQKFATKSGLPSTVLSVVEKASRPVLRGLLRTGEKLNKFENLIY